MIHSTTGVAVRLGVLAVSRGPSASLLFCSFARACVRACGISEGLQQVFSFTLGLLELVVSQRVLERFESRCLLRIVLLRKAEMQLTVLLPRSNLFEGLEVRHLTFAVTFASSDVPVIAMVDYYLMVWLYLLFGGPKPPTLRCANSHVENVTAISTFH